MEEKRKKIKEKKEKREEEKRTMSGRGVKMRTQYKEDEVEMRSDERDVVHIFARNDS